MQQIATSKSVIQYEKNTSPSQSAIVTYIHGGPVNRGATTDQTRDAITNWGVVSSRQYNHLSYNAVQHQVNNDSPIIAVRRYGGPWSRSAHQNVVYGYDTSNTRVFWIDPFNGNRYLQSYQSYLSGYSWNGVHYTWIHSIFDFSG
jgi:hypothetical protein